jgi:hypothetical protein
MNKIAFTMVGAAALAAGALAFATPAFALDDQLVVPGTQPAPAVYQPGVPLPGYDFLSSTSPNGEKLEIQLAPSRLVPEGVESEDDGFSDGMSTGMFLGSFSSD